MAIKIYTVTVKIYSLETSGHPISNVCNLIKIKFAILKCLNDDNMHLYVFIQF